MSVRFLPPCLLWGRQHLAFAASGSQAFRLQWALSTQIPGGLVCLGEEIERGPGYACDDGSGSQLDFHIS